MAREFKLPDLGEGIHEGEIVAIPVKAGDHVNEGDTIFEVETDKAAVEIPSPFTGEVVEIRIKSGDLVRVGDVVMTFSGDGAKAEPAAKKEGKPKEEQPKAATEEPATPVAAEKESVSPKGTKAQGPVPASPATRKLARELGVDLRQVPPTGPAGQVTAEDVKRFAESPIEAPRAAEAPQEKRQRPEKSEARPIGIPTPTLPDFAKWGPVERIPVRSIRRATAKQMALSWSQIPHVHNQDMVDVTQIEEFRQRHRKEVEAKGGKLSLTVFAVKAIASALKAFPRFNASLDAEAGETVIKHYYNIGVAVNTDDGLIVPVIKGVDNKSIVDLSVELTQLVEKTRTRKVPLEDLQGGTFTITNVGPMGGGYFAPIINFPEVAILGMGQARLQPAVVPKEDGGHEIVPRLLMPVVLCIDHRVLDGGDAITFLRTFIAALEDPEEMLLNLV